MNVKCTLILLRNNVTVFGKIFWALETSKRFGIVLLHKTSWFVRMTLRLLRCTRHVTRIQWMRSELWGTCFKASTWNTYSEMGWYEYITESRFKGWEMDETGSKFFQWRVFVFMFACLCKVYTLMDKCNKKLNQLYSFKCRCEISIFSL